jgi:hypothetical protein
MDIRFTFVAAAVMTLKTEKSEVLPPMVCEDLLAVNVETSITSRMCPAVVFSGLFLCLHCSRLSGWCGRPIHPE